MLDSVFCDLLCASLAGVGGGGGGAAAYHAAVKSVEAAYAIVTLMYVARGRSGRGGEKANRLLRERASGCWLDVTTLGRVCQNHCHRRRTSTSSSSFTMIP